MEEARSTDQAINGSLKLPTHRDKLKVHNT